MQEIKGCITALITPFDINGEIDEVALKDLIVRQIDEGVHGLVPCGTTGESPTLSHKEHEEVIKITIETVKKRIPVIAGTGSNSTEEALRLTAAAEKAGADASLQVVPYYNKPNQLGLYEHFNKIAKNTSLRIILYNIPGRSVVNLETSTIKKLVKENKNIVGIKEASGDIDKVLEIKNECPENFIVLSGEDSLNFQVLKAGGNGYISVTSNIVPKKCSELFNNFMEKNMKKAEQINNELGGLNKILFVDTNPIPIKYALHRVGLCSDILRLPLTKLDSKKAELVSNELKILKLI
ncbi:MAG TPA: 4-hydroxy-tetrahydrodipicolinate synthase [Candidatus Dadabacteria bacterium]|jgi:4-hydroxy-tetrahydrodipicolinate synthase|nr:4-hydroxy-tetrahydrodipicolinate synthase [Candidatus Dadabacteria bacterium]